MYTITQPTQEFQLPIGIKKEVMPQPRKHVAFK